MNSNIKRIIGKYLLPSFEDVRKKKLNMMDDLYFYIILIQISLDFNLISECRNFTNKKYERLYDGEFYWTLRNI